MKVAPRPSCSLSALYQRYRPEHPPTDDELPVFVSGATRRANPHGPFIHPLHQPSRVPSLPLLPQDSSQHLAFPLCYKDLATLLHRIKISMVPEPDFAAMVAIAKHQFRMANRNPIKYRGADKNVWVQYVFFKGEKPAPAQPPPHPLEAEQNLKKVEKFFCHNQSTYEDVDELITVGSIFPDQASMAGHQDPIFKAYVSFEVLAAHCVTILSITQAKIESQAPADKDWRKWGSKL